MANWASVARVGDPQDPFWQEKNLKWIEPVKGQKWKVYAPAAAAFEGLINDLVNLGYQPQSSGGFNYRNIRGGSGLSQHAFGTAIDLNAMTNALGQKATDIPQAAELARKWGLEWGGNWKRPDPMHFEYQGMDTGAQNVAAADPQQQWIAGLWRHAQAASQKTGVDPRLIMAQAALETGYGKSAPNFNYFGIKGPGATQQTLEFTGGKMQPTQASFRGYKSAEESFQDYASLLMGSRYAGVRGGKGLEEQVAALGKSGYATDPDYAAKILKIAQGIPETGYGAESASVHPPTATVGTGGYTAPGADTTPVSADKAVASVKKPGKWDKFGKAFETGLGGLGKMQAPVLGAGGNAPQMPAQAPMPMDAMPIVSGPGGADQRDQLALLMQRLNSGQLWG